MAHRQTIDHATRLQSQLAAVCLQAHPPICATNSAGNSLAPRSAGFCYLLHCIAGAIRQTAVAFDHLSPLLASGAHVFGANIVQGNVPRSRPAQALMDLHTCEGMFSNARDTVEELDAALRQRFRGVKVGIKGTVARFEARAAAS